MNKEFGFEQDKNETTSTEAKTESSETENDNDAGEDESGEVDADKKYQEAFEVSGGYKALEKFTDFSEKLRQSFVTKIRETEVLKMLPASMNWTGASKLLVNQPYVRTLDELYVNAEAALSIFRNAIEEVASKADPKARPDLAPLKTRKRAMEKAKFKYVDADGIGVAFYRLTDIVRATLVFISIEKMYEGLKLVQECAAFTIIEFNDRFLKPIPNAGNYRDIQLTLRLKENGFLCELQMSTESMVKVKQDFGHRDYEVFRRLKAGVKNRDHAQIDSTLAFCQEQLGSKYTKKKFLPKSCHELIHEAAKLGDADILDRLIEYGVDVNARDKDTQNTPLHYAVFHGHERCVWLLLDKYKCKPSLKNAARETPLMRGYFKFYTQPSEQARRAIATLLQMTNEQDILQVSTEFHKRIKSKLQKRDELADYAGNGDIGKMTDLLRDYTDPNSTRGETTALEQAITNGRVEAVDLLAQFGVSLHRGFLPAALETDYEMAKLLISLGAARPDLLPPQATIPCGVEGKDKWAGIACYGSKLFCAPYHARHILVLEDPRPILGLPVDDVTPLDKDEPNLLQQQQEEEEEEEEENAVAAVEAPIDE